jgi:hypothetical protein
MEKFNILLNIAAFLSLFIVFFLKVTDKKKRKKIVHYSYILLMLYSLFDCCFFIKNYNFVMSFQKHEVISFFATFTNLLFISYLTYRIFKDDCTINN